MKSKKKILVVDDEVSMRRNIVDLLSAKGYLTLEAGSGEEVFSIIDDSAPDMLILDINLPGINGLEVLKLVKEKYPEIICLLFTAFGSSEKAIRAMKLGAFDYLEKPFELDEFLIIIERASNYLDMVEELNVLRKKVTQTEETTTERIISASPKMQEIFKTIGRLASSNASVLIQGESGTGKELIADAIQRHSLISQNKYVKINCGAFSESLLESEIFGHEKGAFTGAISQRMGLFEIADGGTIFLDEINTMPSGLQVRLLRILQGQSFFRVGGNTPIKTNVRIIAATNKNIEKEVSEGRFRDDLYYRLNVVRINIPPLRERPEDIEGLVTYFLQKYSPGKSMVIHQSSLKNIYNYHWPGNVRELENTVHRAIIMSLNNVLTIPELPIQELAHKPENKTIGAYLEEGVPFNAIISDFEKKLIEKTLEMHDFNQTKTAQQLSMNRRLLYSKIQQHKIKIKKNKR